MRPSLVIVGAGPRGTGVLERIAANAPELYAGSGLDVHLVDPHPPGAGRIWRADQSPLLWMNSHAEDVTMFTDDTVDMAGPVRPGPTLHEWAGIDGRTFADRRLQGDYLRWVHERALAELPPGVTVHHHQHRALRVTGPREGRQQVWLDGHEQPLTADLVVLALGHLDAEPDDEQRALTAYARTHGLVHLPPHFTADTDLDVLPAGRPSWSAGSASPSSTSWCCSPRGGADGTTATPISPPGGSRCCTSVRGAECRTTRSSATT
ncbi:hypothetical protein GCM10020256_62060 [Streptomyces thermocoprophilus]